MNEQAIANVRMWAFERIYQHAVDTGAGFSTIAIRADAIADWVLGISKAPTIKAGGRQ